MQNQHKEGFGMTTPVQLASGDAELEPRPRGLTVKVGEDMARVQVTCQHQSGEGLE